LTTADVVREKAISLAETEADAEDAVQELLECCIEKRVPVVLARQQFLKDLLERPSDPVMNKAAELLERVLERLPATS
jgi:C4-dicarboxylate-specific signal transduction histidine kinase